MKINKRFPIYDEFETKVKVWCVTPDEGEYIHRFFDTSPFSPSGRYLAALKMPFADHLNRPGDKAEVVIVDLYSGEEKTVAETIGWEFQMGANINWGRDDNTLYYNDVDPITWEPYCVKFNHLTGQKQRLGGTIYRISPDGSNIISANMKCMSRTQYGYGVITPEEHIPRNYGFSKEDGLFITDTRTGERKLLISIAEIFERAMPKIDKSLYEHGECYGFHCKYNPQGDKLIFTMRWFENGGENPKAMLDKNAVKFWVLTMNSDASDLFVAVGPEQWCKNGHHINWFPDGRHLSMNLAIDGDRKLYLCKVRYDGEGLCKMSEQIPGSGHPTVHPDNRHVLTDTYINEPVAFGDGTVPLRWIDLKTQSEVLAARANINTPYQKVHTTLRIDPHPAWDHTNRFVAFNGLYNGMRSVFVADFGEWTD